MDSTNVIDLAGYSIEIKEKQKPPSTCSEELAIAIQMLIQRLRNCEPMD